MSDPTQPRPAGYFPAPANTWNIHLQAHDDLLLVIHAKDMFADAAFADEHAYYKGTIGHTVGTAHGSAGRRNWSAGLAVYDISTPAARFIPGSQKRPTSRGRAGSAMSMVMRI